MGRSNLPEYGDDRAAIAGRLYVSAGQFERGRDSGRQDTRAGTAHGVLDPVTGAVVVSAKFVTHAMLMLYASVVLFEYFVQREVKTGSWNS